MQLYGNVSLEMSEILVSGEDGEIKTFSHGTDQEIGIGTLDAFTPTEVEHLCRPFKISGYDFQIGEGAQGVAQHIELSLFANAGEDFLSNQPDHLNAGFVDKRAQLLNGRIVHR